MASVVPSVAVQATLLAVMGVLLGYLSLRVHRQYSTPGAGWFSLILGILSAGLLLVVGLGFWIGFERQNRWLSVLYAVMLLTPVPWVGFVARFTGRGELLTRRRIVGISMPIIAGIAVLFSPAVVSSSESIFLFGILVVFFYVVMLVFVGGALLIRTTYLYTHLSVIQGVVPAVALIEPWFVLTVIFQPIDMALPVRTGFVTAGMGLVTVLLAASVLKLGLLETAAAAGNIGQEALVEEIDEVVIVTDDADRVVRINESVTSVLGTGESETLGAPLESVIGQSVERLKRRQTVELRTTGGYRTFDVGVSPLSDQHGQTFGHVITLSDVTQRNIRQRQLQVLNRVLRHNLRNKMDTVHALAGTVESPPDVGGRIKRAADELLTTSERAREIEESMDVSSVTPMDVRLDELTVSIVEEVREQYPDARIDHDLSSALTIRSDPAILRAVLSNLIENAARHNDADDPQITVTAEAQNGDEPRMLTVTVRDNGPGISDHERAVIEEGEETPLRHGSGLGLWTARWGARLLGGELALEDNHPRGTIARVRLATDINPVVSDGSEPPA